MNNKILSHAAYGDEPLYINSNEFPQEKDRKQFIKDTERIIRNSNEYKKWLKFIHGVLGINFKCYKSGDLAGMCTIEIHHHPLTLFNLTVIAIDSTAIFNSFTIADLVIGWHFENKVGFVPLNKTNHDKFHNRVLTIPVEVIEGNYTELLTNPDYKVDEHIISTWEYYSQVHLDSNPIPENEWNVTARQYLL
jgi:hypothetical protein